jgi:LysM repeat protein
MTSGYIRFYKVEKDNDCYEIAQDAGVTLKDFYSWNPALNGDFWGFQAKNKFVLRRLAMQ